MSGESFLYHYRAELERVIDGDTVVLDIDLGLGIWARDQKVRLYGINAPEKRGKTKAAGQHAEKALDMLLNMQPIIVRTIKDRTGKYGRWLGILMVDGANINRIMVEDSFAVDCGIMAMEGGAE